MFTVDQIDNAHENVKSGADFPKYIQEIIKLGVVSFETWVKDSHTEYRGNEGYKTSSEPQYAELTIADTVDKERFIAYLKSHQQGQTDYYTFCTHCAETGIERWVVRLDVMTCIYYDKTGEEILKEEIPN